MNSTDILLPGSRDISGKVIQCDRCKKPRTKEGGVDMPHGKFVCRQCWRFTSLLRGKRDHR